MFPETTVQFTIRRKTGQKNSLCDDVFETVQLTVEGTLLVQASTGDNPAPHENTDSSLVNLFLPPVFTERVKHSSFTPLDGKMIGMEFEVIGDPIPYDWAIAGYDRVLLARLVGEDE